MDGPAPQPAPRPAPEPSAGTYRGYAKIGTHWGKPCGDCGAFEGVAPRKLGFEVKRVHSRRQVYRSEFCRTCTYSRRRTVGAPDPNKAATSAFLPGWGARIREVRERSPRKESPTRMRRFLMWQNEAAVPPTAELAEFAREYHASVDYILFGVAAADDAYATCILRDLRGRVAQLRAYLRESQRLLTHEKYRGHVDCELAVEIEKLLE